MKNLKKIFVFVACVCFVHCSICQSGSGKLLAFSDTLNKKRVYTLAGTWTGIYAGALYGLNTLWYKNYPRSSFHFFNDTGEWNQMDKCGHMFTSYFEGVYSVNALKWAGVSDKKAAWFGGLTGTVMQTSIEILDGFSSQWGASVGDLTANTLGSALCISQQLLWNEQRVQLKFSTHPVNYPNDPVLKKRVADLYGKNFSQLWLKDYNGQTYWLSTNISSFTNNEESKFPKWLNIAVGYGADGMYGGYTNTWTSPTDSLVMINRTDIPRTRQFFLAPDIDFTKIKTNSHLLKTIFFMANALKFPAPALEINNQGQLNLHAICF